MFHDYTVLNTPDRTTGRTGNDRTPTTTHVSHLNHHTTTPNAHRAHTIVAARPYA